jgi:hypothetical protein
MPIITYKKHVDRPQMEPGQHHLTIIAVEEKMGGGGTPKIVLTLENDEGHELRFQNFFFTPAAEWRICALLGAIGIVMDEGTEVEINDDLLMGQSFGAIVGHGKPNDKGAKYLEIKRFIPAEKPLEKPKAIAAKPVAKAAPKAKSAQEDDEIPF